MIVNLPVAAAAVLLLAACSSSPAAMKPTDPPAPPSSSASQPASLMQVNGTVQLALADMATTGGVCWASGNSPLYRKYGIGSTSPFDDVKKSAQVVVTDASGRTVGVGHLGAGYMGLNGRSCLFPFTVTGVPGGSKFYGVAVAGQPPVQVTLEQMQAGPVVKLG